MCSSDQPSSMSTLSSGILTESMPLSIWSLDGATTADIVSPDSISMRSPPPAATPARAPMPDTPSPSPSSSHDGAVYSPERSPDSPADGMEVMNFAQLPCPYSSSQMPGSPNGVDVTGSSASCSRGTPGSSTRSGPMSLDMVNPGTFSSPTSLLSVAGCTSPGPKLRSSSRTWRRSTMHRVTTYMESPSLTLDAATGRPSAARADRKVSSALWRARSAGLSDSPGLMYFISLMSVSP